MKPADRCDIIFVCTQMEAAGVQVRAMEMKNALNTMGICAKVVFLYKKRPAFEEDQTTLVLLGHRPKKLRDMLQILHRLWRILKVNSPSAVVGMAHYSSPIAAFVGLLAGVNKRIATQTNPSGTMPTWARRIDFLAGNLGLYTANVAASESVRQSYSNYPSTYRQRLEVIYNGVRFAKPELERDASRRRLSIHPACPLLVTVGRLSLQKNHAFLLEVLIKMPSVQLIIIGEGELRERLEEQIREAKLEDRVRLLGEVEHDTVFDVLAAADVFLFPSLYEAFGLALVEAMAHGVPVVTSNHIALVEVVDQYGLTLPLDVDAWVKNLSMLISDENLRAALGEKAKFRAQEFSLERMTRGFRRICLGEETN